jgi:hypothetical protein
MRLQAILSDRRADGAPYDEGVSKFVEELCAALPVDYLGMRHGDIDQWDGESYVLWFTAFGRDGLAAVSEVDARRFARRAICVGASGATATALMRDFGIAGVVDSASYQSWGGPDWLGWSGWGLAGLSSVAEAMRLAHTEYPFAGGYSTIRHGDTDAARRAALPALVAMYLVAYDRAVGQRGLTDRPGGEE